jgi:hypothetical protein
MLKKLGESEKFKKEIDFFRSKINLINNDTVKKHATTLLNSLISQSKLIDEGHSFRNNGYIDPRRVRDNLEKMIDIRLNLKKIVEDLDNA